MFEDISGIDKQKYVLPANENYIPYYKAPNGQPNFEYLKDLAYAGLKKYKKVTQDANLIKAIEILENTTGKYSKDAILGKNLTNRPIAIEFMNLASINPMYMNFDALGWKKKKNLYRS